MESKELIAAAKYVLEANEGEELELQYDIYNVALARHVLANVREDDGEEIHSTFVESVGFSRDAEHIPFKINHHDAEHLIDSGVSYVHPCGLRLSMLCGAWLVKVSGKEYTLSTCGQLRKLLEVLGGGE